MEQKRKNRSTGFFRSKGFRFVILPFIAAALIFGVIAFIKSTMNAGKLTDFSRMTEDNCIYNGSGMFCYSGGYLKYYDLKNRKNDYESFIGIDENGLNFACGSEIELIYTGGSIYFVGSKRIVDISEGIVKECKCGRNYAAVLIEGADGVSRIEMYNASGEKISTSVFASTVLTNFGFENESSSAFYTAELSTAGKDAAITITTYDLSKNSKNGVISVYGMLVDDVIFTEKSIFVVGTKHLIRYDRKTNKEVYRVLIYGYECQSVSENKKGKQVFALVEEGNDNPKYVKMLTVSETESANPLVRVIALPDNAIYFASMNGLLYVVNDTSVHRYDASGEVDEYTLFNINVSFAKKIDDNRLLIKAGGSWNIFTIK